jgi:signal transduction histidine kinase
LLNPLRSIAFRGALWITLIALLTSGVALSLQYLQTSRAIDEQMRQLLDDETVRLSDTYRRGGILNVAAALRREQELPQFHDFFYVLADADGAVLVGDITRWPDEVASTGFHSFRISRMRASGEVDFVPVETRTVLLDDRYRLLVGRLAEDRAEAWWRYLRAMLLSFLVTGLLGLVLGWWFSRRGIAFVERVSMSASRFLRGRLEERIPVSPRGDEFDRLAETVNACFSEIERVLRSLRAATDGMAHDLKTPLTRIRARLELIEMRDASADELREAVAASRADLDVLLRIVDDVLMLARAEGASAETFTEVDLAEIVAEVLELYEPVAAEREIGFKARTEPTVVRGSRTLIGQLVANLLDNAIKYSPEGQTVTLSIAPGKDGAELCIADRGPGIPAAEREHVLARFVRLDESRSLPGVGLGLSIVSAVARVHRARLLLEDYKPGLRVRILFPAP